jgi:hypothetical protein
VNNKVANSGIVFSWLAWFMAHIEQINAVLQFIALVFAIVASAVAIRYHSKKQK